MKKTLVLAAVLLLLAPISAMAGMSAFMNMDEVNNNDMASVTGQTGITIDSTNSIAGGWVAWGDSDGVGATPSAGYLILDGITSGSLHSVVTIDACTDGGTSYLVIGMATATLNMKIDGIRLDSAPGTIDVTAGTDINDATSLGSVEVGDLILGVSTIKISAH